ncbi:MAG: RidA family protein [Gemmatimonadota bacterium]
MARKRAVQTSSAPAAIGPYSQGYWAGTLFFSAGQIGLDPETGELAGPDVTSQARRALANLAAVLEAAGLSLADVVKTTVFLADMDEFATVNEIYGAHFEAPYPARSTVAAARLPRDARVEIEVIARRRS